MAQNYSNVAIQTTLAAATTAGATTILVTGTTGFPAVNFTLVLDPGTASEELVLVTNVAGTTLTVTRGYDGTSGAAHSVGAVVQHVHSAKDFADSRAHESATAAHGATGAVVGTTNTQTLTGKTISVDSNTVSGIAGSSFVLSDASGNVDGAAAQKAIPAGAVVGTTDTQTLTNKTLTSPTINGTTGIGGAWTSYTPTITAGGTHGNATGTGGYTQVGKTVHFWAKVTLGTTSTVTGSSISVALPVAAKAATNYASMEGLLQDTGTSTYPALCVMTGTAVQLWAFATGGSFAGFAAISSTSPFTWTSTDFVEVHGTYEAA